MWGFGYTDPIGDEIAPIDVYWGETDSFVTAVRELYDNVEKMASDADWWDNDHYEQVLGAIRTIRDDIAYQLNPDKWEDMEFTDHIGEITYYVINY